MEDSITSALNHDRSILIAEAVVLALTFFMGILTMLAFTQTNKTGFEALSNTMRALSRGHLQQRADVAGTDELALMSQELNKTTAQYQESM